MQLPSPTHDAPARRPRTREQRRTVLLRSLGGAVRAHRSESGLTLRALAERAHVSERFLVQLETGEGNISVARLADVADALGTTASNLLAAAQTTAIPRKVPVIALLGVRG